MESQRIEISLRTILITIGVLLGLYIVWTVADLLYSLFIAFILMSALRPLVRHLESRKIPHILSVALVYLCFILFFSFLLFMVIPPLVSETISLAASLPGIIKQLNPNLDGLANIDALTRYIPDVTNQAFKLLGGLFSNAIFVISTLFFGFYFLIEENMIMRFLQQFMNEKRAQSFTEIVEKAEKRTSSWFWGELTLMTVVGLLTFIGLNIIGMRFAVPLAVLAGLLEVVPNIGPMISAIPAFLIGVSHSYVLGISSIILYIIVQQLENNVIVPVIMKKAVGINPIVSLIVLIVGGRIGGVLGVLLSIPAYLVLETIIMEYVKSRRK